MSKFVTLNLESYEHAKLAGLKNDYSAKDQIQFWVRLGRACMDDPDLPSTFVAECLPSFSEYRAQKLTSYIPRSTHGNT